MNFGLVGIKSIYNGVKPGQCIPPTEVNDWAGIMLLVFIKWVDNSPAFLQLSWILLQNNGSWKDK